FAEAQRDLDTALKLDADFLPARLNRAIAYALAKNPQQATDELGQVLAAPREKRLLEAAYYRGQLSLNRGRYREACADFDLVEGEKKNLRSLYLLRARAHFSLKEVDPGRADLNSYLKLAGQGPIDPQAAEAFHQRVRLLRLLIPRLPEDARKTALLLAVGELTEADRRGFQKAALFDDLGAVLEQLERSKEALDAYSRGLELEPKDVK